MAIVTAESIRTASLTVETTRTPPHNDEAEMALLGALLQNNRAYERVGEFLKPEHFANRIHGRVFEAIGRLLEKGQIADQITLRQYFEADGDLMEVGGWPYIMQISRSVVSIINAEDYGRTIHDLFLRRQLIDIGEGMVNEAFSGDFDQDASLQIENAEQRLMQLIASGAGAEPLPIAAAIAGWLANVEAIYRGTEPRGVSSGLRAIDAIIGRLKPGRLYILAGRPSMGKTLLAKTIAFCHARSAASTRSGGVGFFELEEGSDEIIASLAAGIAHVDSCRQENGPLTDADFEALVAASHDLAELPLYLDATPHLSVAQIRARGRRLRRKHKIQLLIADHAGLVAPADPRANRNEQLGQITYGFKTLAKELDIPVVLLCQLSRATESRDDKRPTLADLRESGRIEENADVVMFIFREQYYLERNEPMRREGENDEKYAGRLADWQERCRKVRNVAELSFPKVRQGKTSISTLVFAPQDGRFYDRRQDIE